MKGARDSDRRWSALTLLGAVGGMPVSILCVLSVMAALLCPFGVYAGETSGPPLSSGCEIDYPPFCIVHEDGQADGFSVELLRAALAKMGREVTFRTGPWAEVRGWLERGEVDCLPLVGRTPEREALFDFTVPYLTMHGAIVVRRDTDGVHTLADLRGQRVGVMKGDNAEEFLQRRDRSLEIIATPTFSDAFRALAEGRCDAAVVQRLVALRLLEKMDLSDRLRIIDRPIKEFAQDFCFAVKEGDRETLALLNEGLALVVADGTRRRLHAKWFAHLELPSDRPIVIGGDHNYPPFEFLDKNGRPTGFTVELTRAIAREMNMNVHIQLGPWKDIVEELENGEIDAIQGMFYTPERNRQLDFSPHYLASHYVGLARADAGPPPETIEGLEGHRVAVEARDALLETLAERGIDTDIVTVKTQEDVLRAVRDGRADLGVGVRTSALYFIERNGWSDLVLGKNALFTGQYCYAVPSGSEALLAEFVEGMRLLKNSGEYHRLYEKWMGVYEEHLHWGEVLKVIAMVAGPLLLVALLALLWLWSLRRQVAARTRELRANEQQLRKSREKFRRIFNNANDAMYLHALTEDGMPGVFLEVNDTACEMLGYSRDEFLGVTPQDIEAEERKDNVPNIVSELEAEKYVTFETEQMAKDGTVVPVEISSHLFEMGGERRILSVVRDITERKRAEESLRLFKIAIETSSDAVGMSTPEGRHYYQNHSFDALFGEAGSDPPATLYADEEVGREVFATIRGGSRWSGEVKMRGKDGQVLDVMLRAYPIKQDDGTVTAVVGMHTDITERKRKEQEIRRLNSLLRAIRNVNQIIVEEDDPEALLQRSCQSLMETRQYRYVWAATWDREGELNLVGRAGLGQSFDELLARVKSGWKPACIRRALSEPGAVFVLDPTRDCGDCPMREAHGEGKALNCSFGGSTGIGGLLSFRPAEGYEIDEDEKSVIDEVAGDLGQGLRRMEAEEALERSETRYRRLFETAQDGLLILDANTGQIIDANPFIRNILGYSKGELVGKELWEVGTFRDIAENRERFRHLAQQGYVRYEDLPMQRKNGDEAAVEFVSNTYEADGEQVVQCNIRDITERKAAEEELRRTRRQVIEQKRQRALGTMASGIAHDFNNALSTILGFTDLLLQSPEKLEDRETATGYLGHVHRAASNAAETVRRMRKFYRPREEDQFAALDLNSLVEEAVSMTRPRWKEQAQAKGANIEVEKDLGDIEKVRGNEAELHEMLTNLIFNAVDAMPEGGILSVRTRGREDEVLLEVTDTGIGMSEEEAEHCLEPFFTTKPETDTGLGLSIVHGIVERHEGKIEVKSEEGKGTTFRIHLPVGEETEEERPTPAGEEKTEPLKVLVVEDEDEQRELLREYLRMDEHEVETAPDGREGLRMFMDGYYDLVITDRSMPELGGDYFAAQVKKEAPGKPVIMLTGFGDMMEAAGEEVDAVDIVLSKPVTLDKLREAISGVREETENG